MITIGFLHTAEVHVPTFRTLTAESADARRDANRRSDRGSPVRDVHVVDDSLLADARRVGIGDPVLRARIARQVRALAARCDVVVCTCSTIGGVAEATPVDGPVVVGRVDRPMARMAVALSAAGTRAGGGAGTGAGDEADGAGGGGGRADVIAVATALASTLGPTLDLLAEEASAAGVAVDVRHVDCGAAWPAFEANDMHAYHSSVAAQVRAFCRTLGPAAAHRVAGQRVAHERVAAVVLAQASMAGAAALLADEPYPVLSSPRLAVEWAIERAIAGAGALRPPR